MQVSVVLIVVRLIRKELLRVADKTYLSKIKEVHCREIFRELLTFCIIVYILLNEVFTQEEKDEVVDLFVTSFFSDIVIRQNLILQVKEVTSFVKRVLFV